VLLPPVKRFLYSVPEFVELDEHVLSHRTVPSGSGMVLERL